MTETALFASSFLTVLLLVIQSINNNHGYMGRAFWSSFGIGGALVLRCRMMPDPRATNVAPTGGRLCAGAIVLAKISMG